jgi:hypothetical protein
MEGERASVHALRGVAAAQPRQELQDRHLGFLEGRVVAEGLGQDIVVHFIAQIATEDAEALCPTTAAAPGSPGVHAPITLPAARVPGSHSSSVASNHLTPPP